MIAGSSQIARVTAPGTAGAAGVRLSVSRAESAGTSQRSACPRGRPRPSAANTPVQSTLRVPASVVTVTAARMAPARSRQSWGSNIARAVNATSASSANG